MTKALMIPLSIKAVSKIMQGATIVPLKKCPKIEPPFKVYVYLDKVADGDAILRPSILSKQMQVVGEFVCEKKEKYSAETISDKSGKVVDIRYPLDKKTRKEFLMGDGDMFNFGRGKVVYGLRFKEFKEYDKAKELWNFRYACRDDRNCDICKHYHVREDRGICNNIVECASNCFCYVEESN